MTRRTCDRCESPVRAHDRWTCNTITTARSKILEHQRRWITIHNTRTPARPTVWVKKIPLGFSGIFTKGWEFFNQILGAYYTFLSTLHYKFLFNYLQLWRSYAILRATTQFTSYAQNVHHWPERMLAFSAIFFKRLGILSPNFTCLLHVPIYARIQIFV